MTHSPYTRDDARYMSYYMKQAGGELPGFIGASTQYGNGLGGIFRSLFRMALPLLKSGFSLAKPHLKTAATNIAGDVVSNITRNTLLKQQDGSGLVVYSRRPLKRPPSRHGRSHSVVKKHLLKNAKQLKRSQSPQVIEY